MFCSSDKCAWNEKPGLIHGKCFEKLEEKGVIYLKSSKGRAREWSDKERLRVSIIKFFGKARYLHASLVLVARPSLRAHLQDDAVSMWSGLPQKVSRG